MAIAVLTPTGRKSGTVTLPKQLFAASISQNLMAQAVRVYLTNQRQGSKKAKTRGEITGSTRKIYRQKGTGQARHGDRYAPIFVGGGVTHGPTGKQNYRLKLTKTMRHKALASALSSKAKAGEIAVVTRLDTIQPKTKRMNQTLEKILKALKKNPPAKISLILPEVSQNIVRSAANLPYVTLLQARELNTYDVLNGGLLIFVKQSLDILKQNLKLKTAKPTKK